MTRTCIKITYCLKIFNSRDLMHLMYFQQYFIDIQLILILFLALFRRISTFVNLLVLPFISFARAVSLVPHRHGVGHQLVHQVSH